MKKLHNQRVALLVDAENLEITAYKEFSARIDYKKLMDAIDEASGKVLWSWTPPGAGEAFHRNIIATRNLLFFSTDQQVYALDLASKKVVWTYPQPGMLALSANRTLYIATGARESDGKLVAIRLK